MTTHVDSYRAALAAVVASAALWAAAGDLAGFALFGLAGAGLVAMALLPVSRSAVAWLALVVCVVLWLALLGLLGGIRSTSTVEHGSASAALACVLARPIVRRRPHGAPLANMAVIAAVVLAIGVVWELSEWTSDALFGTGLAVSLRDSLLDLAADVLGASLGAAGAVLWMRRTESR